MEDDLISFMEDGLIFWEMEDDLNCFENKIKLKQWLWHRSG
jgi:hypothetical protein